MTYEHRSHRVTGGAGVTLHSEKPRDAYGDPATWAADIHAVVAALDVLPAIAEHHARLIPHAKTSWYEGIGHTPFREEPDRFNAELRAFASSL
jgi:pimeloyl-ACP methyl ester carboxylesterase